MNYKEAVRVLMTITVILNRADGPGTVTVKPFRANITLTEGNGPKNTLMVLAPDNMGSTNNNRSGLGSFIGGVVAGIALLCLVVIALVVILMKKRANSQKGELGNDKPAGKQHRDSEMITH
ncbi:hypothetical protein KUTeg_009649, partial [Tegillarca granosa]